MGSPAPETTHKQVSWPRACKATGCAALQCPRLMAEAIPDPQTSPPTCKCPFVIAAQGPRSGHYSSGAPALLQTPQESPQGPIKNCHTSLLSAKLESKTLVHRGWQPGNNPCKSGFYLLPAPMFTAQSDASLHRSLLLEEINETTHPLPISTGASIC